MPIEEKKWESLGKHHDWRERDIGDIEFHLVITERMKKVDNFVWNSNKQFKNILEILRIKYGMEYRDLIKKELTKGL